MAAQYGNVDSLQVLVHAKADLDKARTNDGATPAFVAGQNGHMQSLKMLVQAKVDFEKATTNNGMTPAFMAARNWHTYSLQVPVHATAHIDRARALSLCSSPVAHPLCTDLVETT